MTVRPTWRMAMMIGAVAVLLLPVVPQGTDRLRAIPSAAAQDGERRPYDEKLLRLAEVLGAIHYLRALCNSGEGQGWRDRMTALIEAEGASAARRAMLTQSFNRGFRTYSRNYRTCTPNAETANKRFLAEAADIAGQLLKSAP